MVSIIHSSSGITLFTRIFEKFCEGIDNDSELVGCFISALKKFATEFGQDTIKQIEMNDLKFLIYEKDSVLAFFLLDQNDNSDEYKKLITMCMKSFLQMYGNEISSHINLVTFFDGFNQILQEILKISPSEIEPSCMSCEMGKKYNCLFKQVQKRIMDFKKSSSIIQRIS